MIQAYRKRVDGFKIQRKLAICQVEQETDALDGIKTDVESTMEAQHIVQHIAQTLQQKAHAQISSVVTRCLNAVFEDDVYEFQIRFDRKRGKTEAKLVFIRDGLVLDDPLNEIGGGVVDVASLALRCSCILLSRPPRRRLLVLDEPFRNVRGVDNRERTRQMLVRLSEELGIQIILNTDVDSFRLGAVIELE